MADETQAGNKKTQPITNPLTRLHQFIVTHYNAGELRTLCFDLRVDYDDLGGETKSDKIRELILHLGRQRQLGQLLSALDRTRPGLLDKHKLGADPAALELLHAALPAFENPDLPLPPAPGEPPYKGLRHFDETDAHLFFGRETLTAKLVNHLREHHFLAIVGASGSGKSSLVRAGLIPALRRGKSLDDGTLPPDGSADWPIHVITPTGRPLETLAASLTRNAESVTATATLMDDLARDPRCLHLYVRKILSRSPGTDHLLLVVDQFEELFALCKDDAERRAFVDNLMMAVAPKTAGPTILVVTLRADFYTHCAQYDVLRESLAQRQEYIGPMDDDELRRAIEEPATRNDWDFEPGLVDLLLRDAGDEPGALPLLSHALRETWERRQARTLTLAGYGEAGGVHGAIARTAETAYQQKLTPTQQTIARNIFLRLTELGAGSQVTRRRATLAELEPAQDDAADVATTVRELADARLLTTGQNERGDEIVDVAHEALIRGWARLREWIDEDRAAKRTHQQLTKAAQEWQQHDKDKNFLHPGGRLAAIEEWASAHAGDMNVLEQDFIQTSKRAVQRQRRRVIAFVSTALTLITVFAIVATLFGIQAGREAANANRLRIIAESRALAAYAESVVDDNPELAVPLGLEAVYQTHRDTPGTMTAEASSALHRAIARSRWQASLHGHTGWVLHAAWSGDDARILTASKDNTAKVWDASTSAELFTLNDHTDEVLHAAWSGDDTRILTASEDHTAKVWDASTGALLFTLSGHDDSVTHAAWSGDDSHILTASKDNTAKVWDASTGVLLFTLSGHDDSVPHAVWSGDDARILTASEDHTAKVWDAFTGTLLFTLSDHKHGIRRTAWSGDDARILTASYGGTVKVWDASIGVLLFTLSGHKSSVTHAAWSGDDARILTASDDHTVKAWDASTGVLLFTLSGHKSSVTYAAWSGDDAHILTASEDNTAKVWDTSTGALLFTLSGREVSIRHAAWSGDDARILTTSAYYTAQVWDASTSAERFTLSGHTAEVLHAAWSGDDARILTASRDHTAKIWDASTGALLFTLSGHTSSVTHAAWSSDDARILTTSHDGTAQVWDAFTGAQLLVLSGHTNGVTHAAWSGDDARILTTSSDNTAKVWDASTGALLFTLSDHIDRVWYAAWSGDDARILTASSDNTVKVWDASTGVLLFTLNGHTSGVSHAAWSGDDARILTASFDNTAKVWDASTGAMLFTLSGHTSSVYHAVWSGDDARILTTSRDASAKVWDASTGALLLTLSGHTAYVWHAVWSSDDARILTASYDGSAKVWDAFTGAELFTLSGHTDGVNYAAWSSSDKYIVTASSDGSARIYFADVDALIEFACARASRNMTSTEWERYMDRDVPYRKTCPDLPQPAENF